jgi:hypothetical protein
VAAAPNSPPVALVHQHGTQLQHGIRQPKKFTDGMVRWGMHSTVEPEEPTTLGAALNDRRWVAAMDAEFDALLRNGTWHLVPRPKGKNIIGSKWVYKVKWKVDGTV